MKPNSVVAASSLHLEPEPVPADQRVDGTPGTAAATLTDFGGLEVGIWEMTPGVMRDIEADEVDLADYGIEKIVRDEMTAIGGQEILFPALLPRAPYETTNRWTEYGDNLFRLADRRGNDYLLGPTHEELFTMTGGRWDVPQAFIGDRYLGDDDDLARLSGSGELSAMMS